MRGIAQALASEFSAAYHARCTLVAIEAASGPVYLTDYDVPVRYGGAVYEPRGLRADGASVSMAHDVDRLSLSLDAVYPDLLILALGGELSGCVCRVWLAALAHPSAVIGAMLLFQGLADSPRTSGGLATLSINIYSPMIFWTRLTPRRTHLATCPWAFAGSDCGYVGGELWCDQSWDRCAELANTAAFGGFRTLAELADKEIYWGG